MIGLRFQSRVRDAKRGLRLPSKRWFIGLASASPVLAILGLASPVQASSCEDLARLDLPNTTILNAESMPEGGAPWLGAARSPDLPAACRVVVSVRAEPDSDVRVEVWLPSEGWDGLFHGNGNGGFAGVLSGAYGAMAEGLRRGYVTAVTDTGTAPATPLDGAPLQDHPRKWRDWGRLSTHVMTMTGKAIAEAYYASAVRRSYYTGCSTGGQQGLIEALYYPDDYDGILVGAPVINRTWGHAGVLTSYLAANRTAQHRLGDEDLALLHKAVLDRCGGLGSGLASDAFLGDPEACDFDPEVLKCRDDASTGCLTDAQIDTVRAFYAGPSDRLGRPLFHGWPAGSEAPGLFGWNFLQTSQNAEPPFVSLFHWVFGRDWDWRGFEPERDMRTVDARLGPIVNDATRGDLRAFRAKGGKLILYHGWEDSLVPPAQTIAFYQEAGRQVGDEASLQGFARLFMVPGMMHCAGGAGPTLLNSAADPARRPPSTEARYDLFSALEDWVEQGRAPDQVVATRYVDGDRAKGVAMQRPVCPYPARAWYRGDGDVNDARSFTCVVEDPRGAAGR